MNRKADLKGEENYSFECIVYSVKIHQDVCLEFVHFSVYVLYFNKSYLSNNNKKIGLPGSMSVPVSIVLPPKKHMMNGTPRNFLHQSQPV